MEFKKLGITAVPRWFCYEAEVAFQFLEKIILLLKKKSAQKIL